LLSAKVLPEDTAGRLRDALSNYGGNCAVNVTKKGQTSYTWPISERGGDISISAQRDPYTGTVTSFSWSKSGQGVSLEDTAAAYLSYLGFSENSSFSEGGRDMPTGRDIIRYSQELQLCVTVSELTFGEAETFTLQVQSMTLDEYLRAVG
jgi:hypothetical protein